ncbi:MAG TPA: GNAT family N-acetyltransferase [Burkholderiales bacterium]|nr:GNAT family N-acetyltransferase [Burkholderiales bacterium]
MDYPQRLRTPRLLFSRIAHNDLDDFIAVFSHPRVPRTLDTSDAPSSADLWDAHIDHWVRYGYGWWTVREPQTNRFLGCGGLQPTVVEKAREIEVAWAFPSQFSARGYASELVRITLAQGFVRLGAHELVSVVPDDDAASRRLVEKAGFLGERQIVRAHRRHVVYRVTATAWCAAVPVRETRTGTAAFLHTV